MNKIGLIIPVYNLSWMTINLLESIKACSDLNSFHFIIVDNGSSLQEFEKVNNWLGENDVLFTDIRYFEPIGFVKAVNRGIEEVIKEGLDYFFVLNNDTIVTPGWDIALLQSLKKPNVAIVGPMTSPPDWRDLPGAKQLIRNKIPYARFKENMDSFAKNLDENFRGQEKKQEFLPFYCAGFNTHIVKRVGTLDEQFNMGLFDDDDYCHRIKEAGYKIILRQDVYVHHYHRSTWIQHDFDYFKLLDENRAIFIKKWGFDPWDRLKKNE